MKKKWGDETRDRKKMGRQDARQKKWGDETQEKKIGRQDARQKKWGTDMRQKNGETRCETKISSPKASNGQQFLCAAVLSP